MNSVQFALLSRLLRSYRQPATTGKRHCGNMLNTLHRKIA
jgi:hypothetical protein